MEFNREHKDPHFVDRFNIMLGMDQELQTCKASYRRFFINILIWYWYTSPVQHSIIYYLPTRVTATFNMWPNSATRTLGAVTALLLWDRESLIYILLITAGSLSRWCSLHFSSVMWAVSWQIARTLQRPINFLSLSSAQLVMLWHLSCAANEWIGERRGHFLQSNSNPPHPIISM